MVDRKRRYIWRSLLLPVLVTLLLVALTALAAVERRRIVGELCNQIAQGGPAAVEAIDQLARMHNPPMIVLVAAAASPKRQLAAASQMAIGELLLRCERQVEVNRSSQEVADKLSNLATALAKQRTSFSAANQPWLGSVAREILRLGNQLPAGRRPALAANCDKILASVEVVEIARTPFSPHLPGAVDADSTFPDDTSATVSSNLNPNSPLGGQVATPNELRNQPLHSAPFGPDPTGTSNQQGIAPGQAWEPQWFDPKREAVGVELPTLTPTEPARLPGATESRPSGGPNMLPPPAQLTERDLPKTPSRQLLQRWMASDANGTAAIEQELNRRGFGRLGRPLVEKYLSDDPSAREELVDEVLSTRGAGSRTWLMLLAEDPSADVRLAAVTAMATSNDRALLEKAWQVAIRDRDPRIADLAARLRDRRAGDQRR